MYVLLYKVIPALFNCSLYFCHICPICIYGPILLSFLHHFVTIAIPQLLQTFSPLSLLGIYKPNNWPHSSRVKKSTMIKSTWLKHISHVLNASCVYYFENQIGVEMFKWWDLPSVHFNSNCHKTSNRSYCP